MTGVSVVLPNWNGGSLLPRCLGSLRGRAYGQGLREAIEQLGGIWSKRRAIRRGRRVPVAAFRRVVRASETMVLESLVRRYAHRRWLVRVLRWYSRWGPR